MKPTTLALAATLAITLGAPSAQATPTTIGFDSDSSDLTHDYSGLTILAPQSGTGPVRTYEIGSAADTPGQRARAVR